MTPEHLSLSIPQRLDPTLSTQDPSSARAEFFFELECRELCRVIPQASNPTVATALTS